MTYEPESLEQREAAALLSAALTPPTVDPAAEASAKQAFREARDEGVHQAQAHRTPRRTDDWRPNRFAGLRRWSLRGGAFGFAISTAVGGVALAAVTLPVHEGEVSAPRLTDSGPTASQSPSGPVRGNSAGAGEGDEEVPPSPVPSESESSWSPGNAGNDVAFCRSFLASDKHRGDLPKGKAFDRWLTERGGVSGATDYCALETNRKAVGLTGKDGGGGGNEGQARPEHPKEHPGVPPHPRVPQPKADQRPEVKP